MPIFNLKEVTEETVGGQREAKVLARVVDVITEVHAEELEQTDVAVVGVEELLLEGINRVGILHHFEQAGIWADGDDLVGREHELELLELEERVELADELHGEVFLTRVVAHLHDVVLQSP